MAQLERGDPMERRKGSEMMKDSGIDFNSSLSFRPQAWLSAGPSQSLSRDPLDLIEKMCGFDGNN